MKKLIISSLFLLATQFNAYAEQGDMVISKQWARPILIAGRPGGAYFHIQNNGSADDKLISVTSSLSPRVEIHEHTMKDGVMRMSQVDYIEITAGNGVQLKPGGYHIMIFNVKHTYAPGDKIDLTLNFEKSGSVEKTLTVLAKAP